MKLLCRLWIYIVLLKLVCSETSKQLVSYEEFEDNFPTKNYDDDNEYDDNDECQTNNCKNNSDIKPICNEKDACNPQVVLDTSNECDDENRCSSPLVLTSLTPMRIVCEYPSRLCDANTLCVNVEQLCNEVYDCQDMSDEDQRCEERQCSLNYTCSHNCHDAPEGFACYCPANYYLQADRTQCSEISSCGSWGKCSQNCVLYNSSYQCKCFSGYSLMKDGITCENTIDAKSYIIFSSDNQLTFYDLGESDAFTLPLENAVSLDFYQANTTIMIFWTDRTIHKIFRATLVDNLLINREVVVKTAAVESLAVDWIAENLYWVEHDMNEIQVSRLNGSFRKTLVAHQMEVPKAIALDPRDGYLFWIDTHKSQLAIKRCSMAGLDKVVITKFDSSNNLPTDLILDYDNRLVYWIDKYSREVRAVPYNGRGFYRAELKEAPPSIPSSIPVTLLENILYWIDSKTDAIEGTDKRTGITKTIYSSFPDRYLDVQTLHPNRQPRDGPNPCSQDNGGCSHLCLLDVNKSYVCGCPHAMKLRLDKKTCIGIDIPRQRFSLTESALIIQTLEALDPRTLKLAVQVTETSIDLNWEIEVLYTNRSLVNPAFWSVQIFTPSLDFLISSKMELLVTELQPNTEYRVMVSLFTWKNALNLYTSKVHTISTPEEKSTSREIRPNLYVSMTNNTWAQIRWWNFNEEELALIDGVRLIYNKLDENVYMETPLIHRLVTNYTLYNLECGTTYEVSMSFKLFSGQTVTPFSVQLITFTTDIEENPYDFTIYFDINTIEDDTVSLYWYGIPYPRNEYVRIYRLVYQNNTGNYCIFNIVEEDTSSTLEISNLNSDSEYLVWLEMFLKNGAIKKSFTQRFLTLPAYTSTPNDVPYSTPIDGITTEDHHWRLILIIISILTALIIIGIYITFFLFRTHSRSKELKEKLLGE